VLEVDFLPLEKKMFTGLFLCIFQFAENPAIFVFLVFLKLAYLFSRVQRIQREQNHLSFSQVNEETFMWVSPSQYFFLSFKKTSLK
jgi:hypothetical protein